MRKIISFILILCMCVSLSPFTFADNISDDTNIPSGDVEPQVNETGWYYKVVDGVVYKRLWSFTLQVWMTDWIPA